MQPCDAFLAKPAQIAGFVESGFAKARLANLLCRTQSDRPQRQGPEIVMRPPPFGHASAGRLVTL
jgi:hypothetical protein